MHSRGDYLKFLLHSSAVLLAYVAVKEKIANNAICSMFGGTALAPSGEFSDFCVLLQGFVLLIYRFK